MLKGKLLELQQRDDRFLLFARELLIERGFHGVTMDAIAGEAGFAKGTLYQRFQSKEALFFELWRRCRENLLAAMQQGAALPGRPRERMLGVGLATVAYGIYQPEDAKILAILDAQSVLSEFSPERQAALTEQPFQAFSLLLSLADEAAKQGDYQPRHADACRNLCFSLWVIVSGCHAVMEEAQTLDRLGVPQPFDVVWEAVDTLMDAAGWRPLSTEWDYAATRERILTNLQVPVSSVNSPRPAGVSSIIGDAAAGQ